MTRLCVDRSRCEGSQLCVLTYPQAFTFGEDGYASVSDDRSSSALTEDEIEFVITLCPTDAIRRVPADVGPSSLAT